MQANLPQIVFEHSQEAMMVTDAQARVVAVNPAFTRLTGFAPDDVLGRNPRFQNSGRHDASFFQTMWETLQHTGHWQGKIWNRKKSNEVYLAWESIARIENAQQHTTHFVAVFSDISTLHTAYERLHHLAHHDSLTGLKNRLLFLSHLTGALQRCKRHQRQLALLFLDLDQFKRVNDTLGHAAGDALLCHVARCLTSTVRAEDSVARLSGDEFVVTLEDISGRGDAALMARKLLDALQKPLNLNPHPLVAQASVGIAMFPSDAQTPNALLHAADSAMYRAKRGGSHGYAFSSPGLNGSTPNHAAEAHPPPVPTPPPYEPPTAQPPSR
jgi:diguanylate cyclase (GGDEF)-like protein/PAS domain S-box-containing protein